MQQRVDTFISTVNSFDVEGALQLFSSDAIIDDVSVGDSFVGRKGIRLYLDRYFVGYHTASRLISLQPLDDFHVLARLDFTGDFGHEIGLLKMEMDAAGKIRRIDADLE